MIDAMSGSQISLIFNTLIITTGFVIIMTITFVPLIKFLEYLTHKVSALSMEVAKKDRIDAIIK